MVTVYFAVRVNLARKGMGGTLLKYESLTSIIIISVIITMLSILFIICIPFTSTYVSLTYSSRGDLNLYI